MNTELRPKPQVSNPVAQQRTSLRLAASADHCCLADTTNQSFETCLVWLATAQWAATFG